MLLSEASFETQNHPLLNHPLWLVAGSTSRSQLWGASHRDFAQADILDRGPNNREATGLRCEDINLIGALTHIAKEAFDSIGRLDVSVHGGREGVKGQEMLFILREAAHCFGIALAVFGECSPPD